VKGALFDSHQTVAIIITKYSNLICIFYLIRKLYEFLTEGLKPFRVAHQKKQILIGKLMRGIDEKCRIEAKKNRRKKISVHLSH